MSVRLSELNRTDMSQSFRANDSSTGESLGQFSGDLSQCGGLRWTKMSFPLRAASITNEWLKKEWGQTVAGSFVHKWFTCPISCQAAIPGSVCVVLVVLKSISHGRYSSLSLLHGAFGLGLDFFSCSLAIFTVSGASLPMNCGSDKTGLDCFCYKGLLGKSHCHGEPDNRFPLQYSVGPDGCSAETPNEKLFSWWNSTGVKMYQIILCNKGDRLIDIKINTVCNSIPSEAVVVFHTKCTISRNQELSWEIFATSSTVEDWRKLKHWRRPAFRLRPMKFKKMRLIHALMLDGC